MGIFTKRDVIKGEEITFNYNVDRYGWVGFVPFRGDSTDTSLGMKLNLVIAVSRTAWVQSVGRPRRMLAG